MDGGLPFAKNPLAMPQRTTNREKLAKQRAAKKIRAFSPEAMKAALENPADFSPLKLLEAVEHPEARKFLTDVYSSFGEIGIEQKSEMPEWARRAWREFWRSTRLLPDAKASDAKQTGHALGVLSHIPAAALQGPFEAAELHALVLKQIPAIKNQAAQLPPEEAAEFFKAQIAGKKRAANVE